MSVWQWVIPCEESGWMMVIMVLPKALEPAAFLFHCQCRPAVCLFCVFIIQNVQRSTVMFPHQCLRNTKWSCKNASQCHESSTCPDKERKKKGSLKDFFKKWGIVWWGRNTFLLREERIFPFVGFLRRWETQRWVHIIALSDKETYHTCVSEAVADYGGEVIKCV